MLVEFDEDFGVPVEGACAYLRPPAGVATSTGGPDQEFPRGGAMTRVGPSAQERSAHDDRCFGCGPTDAQGRHEVEGEARTTWRGPLVEAGDDHLAHRGR
jgi:hypothetical protein